MGLKWHRPHSIYSVRSKGIYSGRKIQNAVKHYKDLLTRKEFEGDTLWIKNAMTRVLAKLKKYSINLAKI